MVRDQERAALEAVASELSFAADDDVLEEALERASRLEASNAPPSIEPRESVGRRSDDGYNALVEVYDEPRIEGSGPLDGLTVAVKDNIAVRELTMTCGARRPSWVPPFDATVVERLLGAGAAVVGKANMDAYAIGPSGEFSELGAVDNPRYAERVPGGSSSGSAAAVAAELVDVALGTDTGGSIRKPAAYCGLVGVKPTHGLAPRHGLVHLAPSLDTIGPIARDVETAARTLEAMAGYDVRDTSSHRIFSEVAADPDHPSDLTIGVPNSLMATATDEIAGRIRDVAAGLEDAAGVTVRDVELDIDVAEAAYPVILGAEVAWLIRGDGVIRGQGMDYDERWESVFASPPADTFNDHIASRLLPGAYVDAKTDGEAYVVARRSVIDFQRRLDEVFAGVDLLLSPTVPVFPPPVDGEIEDATITQTINTRPFNLAGVPAVSVPAGEVNGLPIGAQVAAPAFEDRRALEGARLIEELR